MAAATRPRTRPRQVLPARVRGARRPDAAGVPATVLPAPALCAAALRIPSAAPASRPAPDASATRVSPAAPAAPGSAALGGAGVLRAAATRARPIRRAQTRALPKSCGRPASAARRIQPFHEQGPRDPLSGVPAERAASAARRRQTAQVP